MPHHRQMKTPTPTRDLNLNSSSSSSSSSSQKMILRSHCHGECKCNHSTGCLPSSPPKHGTPPSKHHRQNESVVNTTTKNSPQMKTDVLQDINNETKKNVVSARASVIQRTEFNFRSQTESKVVKTSTSSSFSEIGGGGKSLVDNNKFDYKFSSPRTVHTVAPLIKSPGNTASMTTSKTRISKYSDYSSGDDEIDLEDQTKTDYTYANSSQEFVPPPNMSRVRLHSQGTPYPGTKSFAAYYASDRYDNSSGVKKSFDGDVGFYSPQSVFSSGNGKHSTLVHRNNQGLAYGLDYESDDEDYDNMQIQRKEVHLNEETTTRRSKFMMIIDIVECIIPISTIWNKFWSIIYGMICSILLWDTWCLSRRRLSKVFLLLPLLLILLLLGALMFEETEKMASEMFRFITVPLTSFWAYLAPKTNHQHSPSTAESIVSSIVHNNVNQGLTQMSRKEVENIVRSVFNEEKLKLKAEISYRGNEENVENRYDAILKIQGDELTRLQSQVDKLSLEKTILAEDLQTTKEQIRTISKSDEPVNLHRLRDIELQLDSLKLNIKLIEETQVYLDTNMKNCCRNNTIDSKLLIENHVTEVLLKIMGVDRTAIESSNLRALVSDWLRAKFVSNEEFSGQMTSALKKMQQDLEREVTYKNDALIRLAAAAAVRDAFHQQETRIGSQVSSTAVANLREEEIQKMIHDAILLFDADKTGRADYALETAGGSILSTRCSENHQIGSGQVSLLGIPLWSEVRSPRVVIQRGANPGECWAFKGSEGYLVIQLSGLVQPTAFSIEHIPRSLAPNGNIDSALKEFAVLGLHNEKNLEGKEIGRYTYDADGEPLQFFPVADPDIEAFPIVELRIYSNHGNLDYTCLYRFRVHGNLIRR